MTITHLRQPAPELCDTAEQALGLIALDPNPAVPETSYALGALAGRLTGLRWACRVHTADDVNAHELFYGPDSWRYAPERLAAALSKTRHVTDGTLRADVMFGAGWLAQFAAATVALDDAYECPGCDRVLIDGVDVMTWCDRDQLWSCRWHACAGHVECDEAAL